MILEFPALGTHWWISLPEDTDEELANKLIGIVTEFENNYSRFDDTSHISKLNDNKIIKNPSDELVNMLTYALDVYEATDGIFNISIGSKLERNGYGHKEDKNSAVSHSLKSDIHISKNDIKLSDTTRIDLGGFGKGWLIEKLTGFLKNEGIYDFHINGGGDITVGNYESSIYIEHPLDSNLQIGEINLINKSLASSSNIKRSWTINSKNHAHIVHPIINKNIEILSVHVLGDSILFADTFATVFMLVDREKRLKLANQYGLEFMEILPDLTTYKTNDFNIKLN
jgi:thiamine biosynthesis lipoprotein